MPEVFAISGANFGAASCPGGGGLEMTPKGNCGAPLADCPPSMIVGGACRSMPVMQLQTVIRAIGTAVNDPNLAIAADGFLGNQTVVAFNRALVVHFTENDLSSSFKSRAGSYAIADIASNLPMWTTTFKSWLTRRKIGVPVATVPSPAVAEGKDPATGKQVVVPPVIQPGGNTSTGMSSVTGAVLLGLSAILLGVGLTVAIGSRRGASEDLDETDLEPEAV